MNVGIWIRVSTEEQARGETPKNHELKARMYAQFKGWKVVEKYDLSGVSGKSVLDHPECQRMMADVTNGKIKALIFSKLARLARNVHELLIISEHFQKYKVELVSIDESIDTSTPAGRLLFIVIGALAQWEREEIAARVSASVKVRASQGKPLGGQGPFGYHWVNKRLVPHPEEAIVVKKAFEIFLEEKRLLPTAKRLNEMGYRTRKGAKFGKTTLKRILTEPVYKGLKRANYTKSRGNKKSWLLKPKDEWVWYNVEPIVDVEVWEEANRIIQSWQHLYPKKVPPSGRYLFSGILRCGCGHKMYVLPYQGMKVPRYVCRNCRNKINEDTLTDLLQDAFKNLAIHPDQLVSDESEKLEQLGDERTYLEQEIKKVERKVEGLLDLWNDTLIDKDTFRTKFDQLQQRKNQLRKRLAEVEAEIAFLQVKSLSRSQVITQATSFASAWPYMTDEERKRLVKEVIKQIVIGKESVEFVFYYLPEFMLLEKDAHMGMGS